MSELKSCPFCGSEDNHGFDDTYDPFDNACFMNATAWTSRKLWNTRPLEDKMQAEIEKLKADKAELSKRLDLMLKLAIEGKL